MIWTLIHPKMTHEALGFLPGMLSETDPRPAREQLDANYAHGGGWRPLPKFTITDKGLVYPGDPPLPLLAEALLRDELIRVYVHSWVAVIQPDGSYEVSRMD